MRPVQSIPEQYHLLRSFDLTKEFRLLIVLNLVGLILFVFFGGLFAFLLARSQPGLDLAVFYASGDLTALLIGILKFLAVYVGSLVLHEVVHGICFWSITRSMPKFGLGSAYAYAAAPAWFIPRNQYLVVGLAPLIVISLVGIAILPLLPAGALLAWWVVLTVNASGAVGDLFIVGWLLLQAPQTLINDQGDRVAIYAPTG